MKLIIRWLVRLLSLVLLVAVAAICYVYIASARVLARTYDTTIPMPAVRIRTDPPALERGKYLAERVAVCVECHGDDFGGKIVQDDFAMGRLVSANLTRGRGGIGNTHSDEDYIRAIVHGVRPDGRSVTFMPSADYQFTEEDLGSLLGYVRSRPPVDRELPKVSIGPMVRVLGLFTDFPLAPASRIDHANVRLATSPDAADPAANGAYLASTGGCRGCHGQEFKGGGGPPPGGANITPVGIGDWSEAHFFTAIREHKRPNGTAIDEAMPRLYGQMSDADLRAIFAFLRTVPAAGEKSANQKKGS
jgi:mono/diheme cytochrome c family protein